MTKIEIINKINERKLKVAEILDTIKAETREATNVETIQMENFNAEIRAFEAQRDKPEEKRKNVITLSNGIANDKFSLTRYFRSIKDGTQLSEIETEVRELGKKSFEKSGLGYRGNTLPFSFENRTLTATGSDEIIEDDKFDLLMPLRSRLVFAKAGATVIDNLTGNFSVPSYTGATAFWKGENVSAVDGGGGFTEIEFSPKRLTIYLPVSNLLLIQDSVGAEQKLKQDLINAISGKLENTLLGTAAGSSTQPAGIFNGVTYDVSGATTWGKVVDMETAINSDDADVQNMKYLVHPSTLGKFKQTSKASGTAQFIAADSKINGFDFITTTNIPTVETGKGILFGNWADMYINLWSGMDIVVDNITGAKEGITNFIINVYVDGGVVRDESIAKGWLS